MESEPAGTPAPARRKLPTWAKAWIIILAFLAVLVGFLMWVKWYFPPVGMWGSQVAPRVTWDRYSDEFKAAVAELQEQGFEGEYALDLPAKYSFLASDGFVQTTSEGAVFFPYWMAIPDDAGGYWYLPQGSPEGWDMYGMICTDPVKLEDHWWKCGLAEGYG